MEIIRRMIIEPFEGLYEKILAFLPNFLASVLIFVVGILLAVVTRALFLRIFRALGMDKFFERTGTADLLKKGGLGDSVAAILSKLIGWGILIVFAVISMRALEIPTVERLLERFLLYFPNIFVAAVIAMSGYLAGNFLGRAALIASVNAGIKVSGTIGKFVKYIVFVLAGTMALEQLGIGRDTVIIAFALIFGGVVLALSIAFGLGGRDMAREYLEKKIRGEERKDEISHL
jgi:hypothetical protein